MATAFGSLAPAPPSGPFPIKGGPPFQRGPVIAPDVPPSGTALNPQGGTQLVTDPNTRAVLTANRETDARTALARGLKEYLEAQVINAQGGRQLRFKKIFSSWAEAESEADYPSAAITTATDGLYDWSGFTPPLPDFSKQLPPPDNRYLQKLCEFDQTFQLEVWCSDPQSRQQMSYLVETSMSPVDWMYGCRLYLPHFFGELADFELRTQRYVDSADDAIQRYRKVIFGVHSHMSVSRLVSYPSAKPSARVTVDGDS